MSGFRPCARCGASGAEAYEDGDSVARQAMCAEYSLTPGIVSWLCYDCRQAWMQETMSSQIVRQARRLDWVTAVWRESQHGNASLGLAAVERKYDELSKAYSKVDALAHAFIDGDI